MSQPTAPPTTTAKPGASGYEVSRPGGKCAVSGRPIEPGEKFMAGLRDGQAGLERVDVAMENWEAFEKANLIGFWQTTMPRPEEKKKLFVDDTILLELFERLADAQEQAKLNFRFVLGLILMRKRLLIYETSRDENGKDIWTMKIKGREDRLDLLNPHLGEEQVADVSRQLGEILNENL